MSVIDKSADQVAFESVQVGDIFSGSWGYDQTNIDFFEVVGKTKARIKVVRICSQIVASDGPSDSVVPVPGKPFQFGFEIREGKAPKVFTKQVKAGWKGTPGISMDHSWASLWDGQPERQTASGWGH